MKFSSSDNIKIDNIEGRYIRIQLEDDNPQSISLQGLEVYEYCSGGPISPPEDGRCANGGFELGNFVGWKGGKGTHNDNGSISIQNEDIVPTQHEIINRDNFVDIHTSKIKFPCTGSFVARLGNTVKGETDVARLSYDFTVSPDNADFFFRYALVMMDRSHGNTRNPYFQYRIFLVDNNNNIGNLIEGSSKIIADKDNPFFELLPPSGVGSSVIFRNWTCVNIPLQQHIGKHVKIIFDVADCTEGGHFGYAYIDGLCSTRNDNTPIATISGNSKICKLDDLIFDGSGTCGTSHYSWTICEISANGSELNCSSQDFIGSPEKLYAKNIYNFENGKRYRIKLIAINDCTTSTTVSKDIYIELANSTYAKFS